MLPPEFSVALPWSRLSSEKFFVSFLRAKILPLRLHSLCILQGGGGGGGQRILGGDLKFLEQKKGGYENCLNISGGMLTFCKILSSFCNGFKR